MLVDPPVQKADVSLNPKITSWKGQRIWIVGASSGIGASLARRLINEGARVALSARSQDRLREIASDTDALVCPLDVTDAESVRHAANEIENAWQGIDLTLIVAGTHEEMRADSFNMERARRLIDVNLMGVLHCLDVVLPQLLARRSGGVAIVSSVAGYRGLSMALVYGPTKAALINLAESLYLDVHDRGIGVYLINPGFVDTPLTRRNRFEMPALVQPEEAARQIMDGIARGEFEIHFPKRFTALLKFLRCVPYAAYFAALRLATRQLK